MNELSVYVGGTSKLFSGAYELSSVIPELELSLISKGFKIGNDPNSDILININHSPKHLKIFRNHRS